MKASYLSAMALASDSGSSARDSFVQGECSMFFSSIADHNTVGKVASPELAWDVQMLPVYEGYERHNTVVGGASLWVLAAKTEQEYRGTAAYLQFLATPESKEWFVTNTGYIPVTIGAFDHGFIPLDIMDFPFRIAELDKGQRDHQHRITDWVAAIPGSGWTISSGFSVTVSIGIPCGFQ